MAPDPLGPAAVLESMANALPTHEKDDTTSDLSSSLDCVSLFVHACLVNLGFRLLGFNEDQKIGMSHQRPRTKEDGLTSRQKQNVNASRLVFPHSGTSP